MRLCQLDLKIKLDRDKREKVAMLKDVVESSTKCDVPDSSCFLLSLHLVLHYNRHLLLIVNVRSGYSSSPLRSSVTIRLSIAHFNLWSIELAVNTSWFLRKNQLVSTFLQYILYAPIRISSFLPFVYIRYTFAEVYGVSPRWWLI
jgi:hypothetical protein